MCHRLIEWGTYLAEVARPYLAGVRGFTAAVGLGELKGVAMRFVHYVIAAVAAIALAACGQPRGEWSEITPRTGAGWAATGTLGLGLLIGPSGKITFRLGPMGSELGPETPETDADLQHVMKQGRGSWKLDKGDTTILIPGEQIGMLARREMYENVDTDIWALLVAPGCAVLQGSLEDSLNRGVIVHRTYRLCGVREAAERLRAAAALTD